ncbi:tripartite tricarboxylate transporter substrate binding protein [Roseomonas sp. KE2513]|uniref:Bug family tripartite tricarboxylate transporter substrate binding protein n=1 Tax=Roseomonas sp. KE2513 TaxID=2479202 RepID=UPI0018E02E3A|nr:tripartite tricarboxylate transporter substrate binding protein [Roseomonas sp. KE2513]
MADASQLGRRAALGLLGGALLRQGARAQGAYPARPVRIVVPFPPGGGNDIVARLIGEYLAPQLGQPVVIDNRSGAGGNIGTDLVAKSPADGYTLLHVANTVVMNPYLYRRLPFDVQKNLEPVALLATTPILLLAGRDSGIGSLEALLRRGRERGNPLTYATPGNGTPHHFAMELLKARSGMELLHVPYRGTGQAITDVLAGRVPVLVATPSTVIEFVANGQLLPLATMEPVRSDTAPNVPAVGEFLPGFEVTIWHGLMGPAGMPAEVVGRLDGALRKALEDPSYRARLAAVGFAPKLEPAAAMSARIAADLRTWRDVAASAGIVAE